jgi:hypothetical protein
MRGRKGTCTGRRLGLWLLAVAVACTAGVPALLPPEALWPLQGRAERARGLRFGKPIQARLVSRGKVETLLAKTIGRIYSPELCRNDERVKKTLGLLPADADLWEALLEFQSSAVVGFYAPLDGQLYVVAEPGREGGESLLGAGVDQVLVHELVHALQGIHTDLIDVTLGLLDHDDLTFAIGALLEGDATWAGYRDEALSYGLPIPPPEQVASEFAVDWPGREHRDVPRLVREGLVLQYPAGYALVTQILEAGGVAALDAALLDPPLSSEDVLHPERYLEPSRRGPLLFLQLETGRIAPSSECTTVGANTFGEFGLRIWAQERGMGRTEAVAAAEGWDADRAVVFDCPTGRAFAWLMQWSTTWGPECCCRRISTPAGAMSPCSKRRARSIRISPSTWMPVRRSSSEPARCAHASQSTALRAVATKPPRAAAASARGICDFTWSIRSQPVNMLERIVVSDIGEHWSPKTAPPSTAPKQSCR